MREIHVCFSCFRPKNQWWCRRVVGSVHRAMVKHGYQQKMQPMSATEKRLRADEAAAVAQFLSNAKKNQAPGILLRKNRPHGKKRMRIAARQRPDLSSGPDSD